MPARQPTVACTRCGKLFKSSNWITRHQLLCNYQSSVDGDLDATADGRVETRDNALVDTEENNLAASPDENLPDGFGMDDHRMGLSSRGEPDNTPSTSSDTSNDDDQQSDDDPLNLFGDIYEHQQGDVNTCVPEAGEDETDRTTTGIGSQLASSGSRCSFARGRLSATPSSSNYWREWYNDANPGKSAGVGYQRRVVRRVASRTPIYVLLESQPQSPQPPRCRDSAALSTSHSPDGYSKRVYPRQR